MVVFSLIVIILMRFERGGVVSLTQKAGSTGSGLGEISEADQRGIRGIYLVTLWVVPAGLGELGQLD